MNRPGTRIVDPHTVSTEVPKSNAGASKPQSTSSDAPGQRQPPVPFGIAPPRERLFASKCLLSVRHDRPSRYPVSGYNEGDEGQAQNEPFAAVMARRAKARTVRVLRAQAGIPRTPPVKDPVAHKAAKSEWRRKARWRKMSATKRSRGTRS